MLCLAALSFFVLGIVLVVLGVLQAEMARDLGLSLAQHGLLGAILALGFGAGLTLGGPLVDRLSRRALFVGSCGISALTLIGIDAEMAYGRIAAHLAVLGLGGGCYITLLNAAVIDRYRERAARRLALVHASATAGAGSAPWLIGAAEAALGGGWPGTFHALSALYLALTLLGLVWRIPQPEPPLAVPDERAAPQRSERFLSPKLAALALVIFAYVGAENGLTLLAVPWAVSQGLNESAGRAAISAFWLALMVGRLTLVLRRPAPTTGLLVACGATAALTIGAAAFGSWSPVLALTAAGLALGPVYPAAIALTGQHFPRASGTALGLVSGAGACGGFALPWLSGALGDALTVTASIVLLAGSACTLAIAALMLPANRLEPS